MEHPRRQALVLVGPQAAGAVVEHVQSAGLQAVVSSTTAEVLACLQKDEGSSVAAVVCALGTSDDTSCWPVLAQLCKGSYRQVFSIVLSKTAASHVRHRLDVFAAGARMVTESLPDVGTALQRVAAALQSGGEFTCPHCGLSGLSETAIGQHMSLYHAAEPNCRARCPVCKVACTGRDNLPVHMHNVHGPAEDREPEQAPYPAFAWCVCRREADGKFLLVNEPAGLSGGKPGYWLPAGRVDRGESLEEAARRECLEEAGLDVRVVGVLRFMVDNTVAPEVMRVAMLTVPTEGAPQEPKSLPNFESCGALWASVEDLGELREEDYRSPDPAELYPKVASGALRAYSVDTEEFRALEALMRRLTSGDRSAKGELPLVWAALLRAYPASVFGRD